MPKMMPVAKHTATRKAKTVASIVNLIQYGFPTSATAMSNSRTPTSERIHPKTPPRNASSVLSTRS